jgi:hypothetical protein
MNRQEYLKKKKEMDEFCERIRTEWNWEDEHEYEKFCVGYEMGFRLGINYED